jgi:hypothetical protein
LDKHPCIWIASELFALDRDCSWVFVVYRNVSASTFTARERLGGLQTKHFNQSEQEGHFRSGVFDDPRFLPFFVIGVFSNSDTDSL